jgi:DNA-binding GntR family transcriptional regulator
MVFRLQIELPKSLSAIVEERLRDAIINAELSFGQALTEDAVGLSLGVSRTPMREALTRLETQGLVVIVPKKGTFVFQPTLEDVEQLASFRLMLETGALERCMAGSPDATLADMRRAFDAMRAARERGDAQGYARADTEFHESFFTHCGNAYLSNAYRTISGRVAALRAHLSVPRSDQQDISFDEHLRMIEAFESRDAALLSQLLGRHILRAQAVYAEALRDVKP